MMPLSWNVENVKDNDEVTTWVPDHDDPSGRYKAGDRMWHPVTEALVWLSISTGINEITEENAAEVFARINLSERLNGPQLIRAIDPETGERPKDAAAFITPEEVERHIGLWTNASPKTRTQFLKTFEYDLNSAAQRYERATKKEEAAQ